MINQCTTGYRTYNKLLAAFIHEGDSVKVKTDVASIFMNASLPDESLSSETFLKAMYVPPYQSHGSELIFMEVNAVSFIGSDHQFMRSILDSCPDIKGILAVELGELLTVPNMKLMTASDLSQRASADLMTSLVYSINLEITERINASAEIDQPDVDFVELRN